LTWYKDGSILTNGLDSVSITNGLNNSDLTVQDNTGEEGGLYDCFITH